MKNKVNPKKLIQTLRKNLLSNYYQTTWSNGFSETYESGNISWLPSNTDSLILQIVKLKSQPLTEAF